MSIDLRLSCVWHESWSLLKAEMWFRSGLVQDGSDTMNRLELAKQCTIEPKSKHDLKVSIDKFYADAKTPQGGALFAVCRGKVSCDDLGRNFSSVFFSVEVIRCVSMGACCDKSYFFLHLTASFKLVLCSFCFCAVTYKQRPVVATTIAYMTTQGRNQLFISEGGGGNFLEISFDDVIVIIQPWSNFFVNGHI